MQITMEGKPLTLVGQTLHAGDSLPHFVIRDTSLNPVHREDFTGICVFLSIPSLDTGVCDLEVKRFHEQAGAFEDVSICVVSMDLPFAQTRWCGANKIQSVRTYSDYFDHSFSIATGTRIEELGLLARAVFLVDELGKLVYVEYVPELTNHPDYNAAFSALEALEKAR